MFSEGYFRRLAHSSLFKREDLAAYFQERITQPIESFEKEKCKEKERRGSKPIGEGKQASLLTNQEQRAIRDKHYTPEVMREMWNMIKQRQYKVKVQD